MVILTHTVMWFNTFHLVCVSPILLPYICLVQSFVSRFRISLLLAECSPSASTPGGMVSQCSQYHCARYPLFSASLICSIFLPRGALADHTPSFSLLGFQGSFRTIFTPTGLGNCLLNVLFCLEVLIMFTV